MPDRQSSDYLLRRAADADAKALKALDPAVAAIHRSLARECRARAAEIGVGPGE